MKIGIVTEYYYPTLGGIQEHVHHFALAARRMGHDVRILTPHVRDELASVPLGSRAVARDREEGVIRVGVSVPLLSGSSIGRASAGWGLSTQVKEVLRSERFDVLHLHSPLMPTLPLVALRLSDSVNVGTFHSVVGKSFVYGLFRSVIQRYADRLHAAIGVSETSLEGIRRYVDAPWRIVPNGVDVQMFASGRRRPEFGDRPNLLHVGRFDPRNGVDRVIKAWIAVRRGGTDARLILVGDGPLRPHYQAMVPPDLRGDAHFVGFVPSAERSSYYASGDVLLCPAVGGTFGIIALEAMAAGCPVIAADTPGFRNVITDGAEGYLVDVAQDGDCTRLADRAAQLLADPALRARCVELGRAKAACFDWPVITARVLAIYEELLRTPHARVSPAA
jgi:phosphatidylinositol alpha-mannosyltransferase